MIRLNFIDMDLFLKCSSVTMFVYGCFLVLVEHSFFYLLVPVCMYSLILFLSIPPPKEENVNEILGVNRRVQLRNHDPEMSQTVESSSSFIAHRAAGFDGTENSISGIKLCSRNGCKIIHVDVKFSADNVGVVTRQSNIVLSENESNYPLEKEIEESSLLEIKESCIYDATSLENVKEKIPTVQEVVTLSRDLNAKIMLNVIHSSYHKSTESTVNVIMKLYERNPDLYHRCIILSSDFWLLYRLRRKCNSIVVALQWEGCEEDIIHTSVPWLLNTYYGLELQHCTYELVDFFSLWFLASFLYRIIGISAVVLPKHVITPGVVENWDRKNVRCIAAVVNLSTEKSYYKNVLGIAYLTDTITSADTCDFVSEI